MTDVPRPAETGLLSPPPPGVMSAYPRPGAIRPHILVVNGRKVRHPVFVLGAPCSGTEMLARALKRSAGFHLTLGQRWVLPVVHAFARNPSIARGRQEAAATVLRDAFAQGWLKPKVNFTKKRCPIHDPESVFAFDSQPQALVSTDGSEDSFVAQLKQKIKRHHTRAGPDLDSHLSQSVDFSVQYLARKAVLRNANP